MFNDLYFSFLLPYQMPLYVTGVTEQESPFTFGTALPAAKFKWTVSNDKVASAYNLYSSVSILYFHLK